MIYFLIFKVSSVIFSSIFTREALPSQLHPALVAITYLTIPYTAIPEEIPRHISAPRLNCIAYDASGTSEWKNLKAFAETWKDFMESLRGVKKKDRNYCLSC